jgi:hypothetical protein
VKSLKNNLDGDLIQKIHARALMNVENSSFTEPTVIHIHKLYTRAHSTIYTDCSYTNSVHTRTVYSLSHTQTLTHSLTHTRSLSLSLSLSLARALSLCVSLSHTYSKPDYVLIDGNRCPADLAMPSRKYLY